MAGTNRKRTISIPLLEVPVQDDGVHLVLKASINRLAARLVLDTGASRTVLDKDKAKHFLKVKSWRQHDALSTGLGTSSMPCYTAEIDEFGLGHLEILGYEVVLLDLAHVNQTLRDAGMKEIDGVLGGDILTRHKAVIDYGRKTLKLRG